MSVFELVNFVSKYYDIIHLATNGFTEIPQRTLESCIDVCRCYQLGQKISLRYSVLSPLVDQHGRYKLQQQPKSRSNAYLKVIRIIYGGTRLWV